MTASVIPKSTRSTVAKPLALPDADGEILQVESSSLHQPSGINGNGNRRNGSATNGQHRVHEEVAQTLTAKQNVQRKLPHAPQPKPLPTYPLEVGWREVYDEQTQRWTQQPLRLVDLLFPHQSDKETIRMTQGPIHFESSSYLVEKVRPVLRAQGWLILGDVLCYWPEPGLPPIGPDLAAFYGAELPDEAQRSYRVGMDGPAPDFVIEITSYYTRTVDLDDKPTIYASHGVSELLIIDTQTPSDEPWQLLGYRLGEGTRYERILPDAEGGITFEHVGLRFVAIGREEIEVYEVATGLRLLTTEEQIERAEAAEALAEQERIRAEAEAAARMQAEAQTEQERLTRQELEAQLAKAQAHLRALGIEL